MWEKTGMDRGGQKDDRQNAGGEQGGKEHDRTQHYLERVKRTVTDVGTGWWYRQEEAQAK